MLRPINFNDKEIASMKNKKDLCSTEIEKVELKTVVLPRSILLDKELSLEAKGMLAFILAHANMHQADFISLGAELQMDPMNIMPILEELKDSDYLIYLNGHIKVTTQRGVFH